MSRQPVGHHAPLHDPDTGEDPLTFLNGYIRFNSANDAIDVRYLDVVATTTDPEGYALKFLSSSLSGDVIIGFPFDGTDYPDIGSADGSVYFGSTYSGDRSFHFVYNADNADRALFVDKVQINADFGLMLNNAASVNDAQSISMTGIFGGALGTSQSGEWIGFTDTGQPPPGIGYRTGDWAIAADGHVWICTAGGSPGTWADVGSGGGGGGITFATANSGTYLDVETTGVDGSNFGINFLDTNVTSSGIVLESVHGQITIGVDDAAKPITLLTPTTAFEVAGGTGYFVGMGTGETFTMYDNSTNPIFQVTEDGTYHIKTGATWVADL